RCMRSMLSTYKNTKRVSNFRPSIARALYETYSNEGDTIVDPAAGYGGRLLGALPLIRRYIGFEPNKLAWLGNKRMFAALRKEALASADVIRKPAEDGLSQVTCSSVQLVIFSPPYFRRERYSNEASQSWRRYPTYDLWKKDFLATILEECW